MNKPYRLGAHALIFDANDNILLIQHQSYQENEWNFPGGGREDGEGPIENAIREVNEELGLSLQDLKVLGVSAYPNIYDFPQYMIDEDRPITQKYRGQYKDHVFLRLLNSKIMIKPNPDEVKTYRWVALDALPHSLVFTNQYQNFKPCIEEFSLLTGKVE